MLLITLDYEELATPCLTIERRHTWGPTLRAVSDSSSELPSSRPWAWAMRAPCTMFPTWTAEGVTSKTTDTGAWIFLLLKRSVNKRQINYTICVVQITCYWNELKRICVLLMKHQKMVLYRWSLKHSVSIILNKTKIITIGGN